MSERSNKFIWFALHATLGWLCLLFVVGGVAWFYREDVLAGNADFVSFYTAARLIQENGPERLYDFGLQRTIQLRIVGSPRVTGDFLPYIHPPFEMILFRAFGVLSYANALRVWVGLSLISLMLLPFALERLSPDVLGRHRLTTFLAAFCFYPFLTCLWQGQDSILFMWLVLGFLLLLKRGKDLWAGAILGLSFILFNIAAIIVFPVLLKRRTAIILGLVISLTLLVTISFAWLGVEGIRQYADALLKASSPHGQPEHFIQNPEKMHTWMGQLYLLGFSGVFSSAGSSAVLLAAIGLSVLLWRGAWNNETFALRFAATILLAILGNPHVYIYNLSVVFLVEMLVLEFVLRSSVLEPPYRLALLGLLLISPIVWVYSLPLSKEIPIQLSVVWMTATLALLLRIREGPTHNGSTTELVTAHEKL